MTTTKSFTDLRVWQMAHQVVLATYKMTKDFPRDERYGLIQQMRRAATSIPANIAEGWGRRRTQDKLRFYNISEGSAQELAYYFILAKDLAYVSKPDQVQGMLDQTSRMLRKLMQVIDPDAYSQMPDTRC